MTFTARNHYLSVFVQYVNSEGFVVVKFYRNIKLSSSDSRAEAQFQKLKKALLDDGLYLPFKANLKGFVSDGGVWNFKKVV